VSPNEHVDATSFDELACEVVSQLPDYSDVEAMLVSFSLIRAANRIQQDLETSVHRPAGLTWAAFRVLFSVAAVGPTTPAHLAHLSSVSAASISSVLNTLQRNKLVTREPSPEDGRSVVVNLTSAGREAVNELLVRNNAREVAWVEVLTAAERRTLTRLLHKLLIHHPPPPADPGERIIDGPRRERANSHGSD
jgi:DNA-binding MarR family transcriptional regulator